ncbi:hypothetical protein [Actinobacillus pleuropneumoniae]|uniref:hypothetical protein n=1 Tax=Actinobacillus pleuropneumoniae TaxID=715 RepID=UPI003B028CE8
MHKYEYIKLDCDDDPSKDEVLEQIQDEEWEGIESIHTVLDFVAEEILAENYSRWEIYEEDEGVCLAIREKGSKSFEVYWVSVCYRFDTQSSLIFDEDDLKDKEKTM